MLERLRDKILKDLESTCYRLEEDMEERRTYLRSTDKDPAYLPKFAHRYTIRTSVSHYNRDMRIDLNLENVNYDREELTIEGKREIARIKRACRAEAEAEVIRIQELLNEQFRSNEVFFTYTDEQKSAVIAGSRHECKKTAGRIAHLAEQEIMRVRTGPQWRKTIKRQRDKKKEQRDREDIEFLLKCWNNEANELAGLERYAATSNMDQVDLEKEKEKLKKKYILKMKKDREAFRMDRDIREKMEEALALENDEQVDLSERRVMMEVYDLEMKRNLKATSSIAWDESLRQLYSAYTVATSWDAFAKDLAVSWCCVTLTQQQRLEKRAEWDQIAVKYANLFMNKSMNVLVDSSVPFPRMLRTLRERRDELLRSVLELDKAIRELHYELRRKKPHPIKLRAAKDEVKKNYEIEMPIGPEQREGLIARKVNGRMRRGPMFTK
ncbi:Hypothetical protein POVR2_LOCUS275 [uncultured virus]|nr:Hypothetical protein POVR2_LOCUS275 [uncultured virus]